jgi:hypothetical protein
MKLALTMTIVQAATDARNQEMRREATRMRRAQPRPRGAQTNRRPDPAKRRWRVIPIPTTKEVTK